MCLIIIYTLLLFQYVLCSSVYDGKEAIISFQGGTVIDTLNNLRLTVFQQQLERIGLTSTFQNQNGPFTLFVPSNDAFKTASSQSLRRYLFNDNATWHFIAYHAFHGIMEMTPDFNDGEVVTSVLGSKALLNRVIDQSTKKPTYYFQGSKLIRPNLLCTNGIIHVIESIPQQPSQTITEILESTDEFSTFNSAIEKSRIRLKDYQTVLVPTDSAFYDLPTDFVRDVMINEEKLKEFIHYNILKYKICPECLFGSSATTLIETKAGKPLLTYMDTQANSAKYINNARIYKTFAATDGWIISVTEVVLANVATDVFEGLYEEESTKTFRDLLSTSSILPLLKESHFKLSVFAPSNEAFEKLTEKEKFALYYDTDYVDKLIANHIAPTRILMEHATLFGSYNTLLKNDVQNYAKLRVNALDETKVIECARTTKQDIVTSNGIIHLIDRVITPITNNLIEVIQKDQRLRLFNLALQRARLSYSLRHTEMFTIIAPSDWAIIDYLRRHKDTLKGNEREIQTFLRSHIFSGAFFTRTLDENQAITLRTLIFGRSITLKRQRNSTMTTFNGIAKALDVDIRATNGVVHIIDEVLF